MTAKIGICEICKVGERKLYVLAVTDAAILNPVFRRELCFTCLNQQNWRVDLDWAVTAVAERALNPK